MAPPSPKPTDGCPKRSPTSFSVVRLPATYPKTYASVAELPAASLDDLFDQPLELEMVPATFPLFELFEEDKVTHQHGNSEPEAH